MDKYTQKLKNFIQENNIKAELMIFEESTHSVDEAAHATGTSPEDFVKSICLLDKEKNMIVAIVKGEDKVDMRSIRKLLKVSYLKNATPDEILEKTGFVCGGVPPMGYDADFLVDERVLEKDMVFAGGGSQNSLVKVSPKEFLNINGGRIVNIRR